MELGVPTRPREGAHRDRGSNIPTRGTNDTVSRTLEHTNVFNMDFLYQLYSRKLRVSCILYVGGTVTHRTDLPVVVVAFQN